jgi:arylsulfatase A-like enzyme
MRFVVSCFLLSLLGVSACAEPPESRLNLLVIMTDQQRFDALSAAGNTVLRTPNIDRIANEGVLFENAYTPVPVCAPARTSILTGQSIDNTGTAPALT